MKAVVISQRVDVFPDRNETRDALDSRLNDWVLKAGFVPFPIPNSIDKFTVNSWVRRIKPTGLILSGGNDLGEAPNRDFLESNLLHLAESEKIPVLGICRGMQIIAHKARATLKSVEGHVNIKHAITGTGRYREMFPTTVNSFHKMQIEYLPSEFQILAHTIKDNCIEAIRHKHLPWEGWMWHPERDLPFCEIQLQRLKEVMSYKKPAKSP